MIKCLECGSENLFRYTEEVKSYMQKVTAKGKISTQKKRQMKDVLESDHIHCDDCGERFDYETDRNNMITKLMHY